MGKKKTHEEFLEELKEKQPEVFESIVSFIDRYEYSRESIHIKTKYGICFVKPYNLMLGKVPSIKSAINKRDYLLKIIDDKNKDILNHVVWFGNYNGMLTPMLINTKYGMCKMTPTSMISGSLPSLKSAVNKVEYLSNMINDKYPLLGSEILEYGDYKSYQKHMLIRNKFGWCKVKPANLLCGKFPCIKSAVNKSEYWSNMASVIHDKKYDYSEVEYVGKNNKVKIICPHHGPFWQSSDNHLYGFGCKECGIVLLEGGYNKTNADKNKESWSNIDAIVYCIKISDGENAFYKVGITTRTTKERFAHNMPYEYEIISEINTNLYNAVYLESKIHNMNRENTFEPDIKFGGWTECFSKLNLKGVKICHQETILKK